MKKASVWLFVALIPALIVLPPVCAQSDVAGIFADLSDFSSAAAAPDPALGSPAEPVPTGAEPVVPETPVRCAAETGGQTIASVKQAVPVEVEACLASGKAAYADDDWDGAQKFFEAALHRDPYNAAAIKWLRRIASKKAGREEKSYDTTRTLMLENVQAAWNTPKAEGTVPGASAAQHEPAGAERQAAALRNKLENIRIQTLVFQDTGIQQAVLKLSELCRELDPEQKGVNLAAFGTDGAALPTITFSGTDLSALETLDIITQMSGMKYEIGPSVVCLTPVNYEPPQQMGSVEFDVIPSVGSKMLLATGENGTTGPARLVDVRSFFSTTPFPPGASAQYNPGFNVLLVCNAPKHLHKIAGLLDRYNRKALEERSRQVEIETKFIEVSQGALEELGFNWTIGTPGEYITSDTWTMPGGQQLFTDTLRSGEEAFGKTVKAGNRATAFNTYADAVVNPAGAGLVGTAGELLIQKVKGDLKIDLLIRALERSAGADLLSAPKILTKSGETASIHVGEVHWFPTAYDVKLERYAQPSLVPLDYKEERTGVILEVTPDLDPENGTINLKLSPEIRELAGFDEQHVGTIWPEYGDETLAMSSVTPANNSLIDFLTLREESRTINADRLIARRPVFKTRKVNTTVTIEDGSTIAMGGLIKEQLETFKDSVPVLGKIPLLGRLFRSEGEHSVKRNLLIFVTASQVDASGYKKNVK